MRKIQHKLTHPTFYISLLGTFVLNTSCLLDRDLNHTNPERDMHHKTPTYDSSSNTRHIGRTALKRKRLPNNQDNLAKVPKIDDEKVKEEAFSPSENKNENETKEIEVENLDECPICWENFKNKNERYTLSCPCKDKFFHLNCIEKTLNTDNRCPTCRKEAPLVRDPLGNNQEILIAPKNQSKLSEWRLTNLQSSKCCGCKRSLENFQDLYYRSGAKKRFQDLESHVAYPCCYCLNCYKKIKEPGIPKKRWSDAEKSGKKVCITCGVLNNLDRSECGAYQSGQEVMLLHKS